MFSLLAVFSSLAFVHMASANPVAIRAGACNPQIGGSGISIVNGGLEIGYPNSVAGAPLIAQVASPHSPEYIAVAASTVNGGFLLKDVNQPNQAPGLFPTWVNGTLQLETLETPQDGKQGWGFVCTECHDFSTVGANGILGGHCLVVSGWTGQCMQMGSEAGDAVTIVNCSDLGSGPQYFDIVV